MINKLRFYCQKVLPLVYDDSLSYYEVLCKTIKILNDVVENVNNIPTIIEELVSEEYLKDILANILNELRSEIVNSNDYNSATTTKDREIGELVWRNNKIYKVVRHMNIGDSYIDYPPNPNIVHTTIEDLLNAITTKVDNNETKVNNLITNLNDMKIANVKDYGAKGDGNTDDTNAFNLAINDINNGLKNILFIPFGNFIISSPLNVITASNIKIKGSGQGISVLSITNNLLVLSNTVFTISNDTISNIEIYDFSVNGLNNSSVNFKLFEFHNTHNLFVHDLFLNGVGTFATLGSQNDNGAIWTTFNNITGNVIHQFIIVNGQFNGINIYDCQINSEIEYSGNTVIVLPNISSLDTMYIDNCLFQRFNYGIIATPNEGCVIQNIYCNNTDFDGIEYQSVALRTDNGGIITRIYFRDTWFTSLKSHCVSVSAINGNASVIDFNNCDCSYSYEQFIIASGQHLTDLSIENCDINGYNKNTNNVFPGIEIGDSVSQFYITNNIISWAESALQSEQIGIRIGTNCSNYKVQGNVLNQNLSEPLINNSIADKLSLIKDNLGYNPVGYSEITVPLSDVNYTHNIATPGTYYLTNGTILNLNINGIDIGAVVTSWVLNPGDTMRITYNDTIVLRRFIN